MISTHSRAFTAATIAIAVAVAGCSDDSDSGPTGAPTAKQPPADGTTPLGEIPDECKGIEVEGLTHSPGGSVLPNRCAAFDGKYNNPYAIRCVDADPEYQTKWRGDDFCILPPPPELGTQLHVGPASYDRAADYAAFVLEPGEEINTSYFIHSDNDEPRFYYRTNFRMRDGSHHMIVTLLQQEHADGWATKDENLTDLGLGGMGFGGSQRTDTDRPQGTLQVPPENEGLGGELAAHQQFAFNLHHMNRFDEAILREAWTNVWYIDEKDVDKKMQPLTIFGNPADVLIADGVHSVLHYSAGVTGSPRIITLLGHRHASTDRFGIWIEKKSGEKLAVYESFEYTDMPVYQYDSVSMNPKPDVEHRVDGGHSGLLQLSEGDELHFVCDITNRSGGTLKFANELLTGEMCIVFGSSTGGGRFASPSRVP